MLESEVVIPAEVHSDDQIVQVEFDAESWFAHASDDQIKSLAYINFGGGEPADVVAEHLEHQNAEIAALFSYLAIKAGKNDIGFECYVDPTYAMAWIEEHRPHLVNEINSADDDL